MTFKLHLSGNEIRLILRALGRFGGIKKDPKASELTSKIEAEFNRQREKAAKKLEARRE